MMAEVREVIFSFFFSTFHLKGENKNERGFH